MFDLTALLYIGIIILCSVKFYKWATKNNEYFKECGIPHLKPYFLLGNTFGYYFGKYTISEFGNYLYNLMPNERFFGLFDGREPSFFLRDPELIKKLIVKDFDHFEDHVTFLDEKTDRLFGNSLFMLKGKKWRDMRTTLSPAFTGSRMRQMFTLVSECATQTINHFLSGDHTKLDLTNIDVRDVFSRYANDVIATCAFGIQVDSFDDMGNEFYISGKRAMNIAGFVSTLKFILINALPMFARTLNIQLLDRKVAHFFNEMVLNNIAEREREGIFRPDMINILMQVKMGTLMNQDNDDVNEKIVDSFATVEESKASKSTVRREWNNDEIIAQCFLFFIAGFDTIGFMLTFTAYELAINSDIQQKLYEEIVKTRDILNGKPLDYDTLQKMSYMDAVISESLRFWPPAPITERQCTKDYTFKVDEIPSFKMNKGCTIWLPIHAIHMDNQYFPNANKFDPERFNNDNKNKIVPGTYIPFGVGPRNCIGSRFALMEIKAILYYLVLNFSLEPNGETQIPPKFVKSALKVETQQPIKLTFKPR